MFIFPFLFQSRDKEKDKLFSYFSIFLFVPPLIIYNRSQCIVFHVFIYFFLDEKVFGIWPFFGFSRELVPGFLRTMLFELFPRVCLFGKITTCKDWRMWIFPWFWYKYVEPLGSSTHRSFLNILFFFPRWITFFKHEYEDFETVQFLAPFYYSCKFEPVSGPLCHMTSLGTKTRSTKRT